MGKREMLGQVQMFMKRALDFYRMQYRPSTCHSWLRRADTCPQMGWRMGVEVVDDCAQPDRWKIASLKTNMKQFLSGGGSLGSHIRSQ